MAYQGAVGTRWAWFCFGDSISDSEWRGYLSALGGFLDVCPRGSVTLHILHGTSGPDAAQREQISHLVERHERLDRVVANAVVLDSALARGVLMAVSWLTRRPKPFPEKVVGTPADGLAWLRERTRPQLVDELQRSLLDTIPADSAWAKINALR